MPHRVREIRELLPAAQAAHYRLIWIAGGTTADRSATLREFANDQTCPVLDLGRRLSALLLDVPTSLRAASAEDGFSDLLSKDGARILCMDHLDVLFEPSLRLNPPELVRNASRYRMMVVSWPGAVEGDSLVYGAEDHPAHRRLARHEMECQFLEINP